MILTSSAEEQRLNLDFGEHNKTMSNPKLFTCTSCGRTCDHTTSRWDKGGTRLIDKNEHLCKRCTNKRLNGDTQSLTQQLKQMSPEDLADVLSELN